MSSHDLIVRHFSILYSTIMWHGNINELAYLQGLVGWIEQLQY